MRRQASCYSPRSGADRCRAEYQDRASTSTLPPLRDPAAASRAGPSMQSPGGRLQPFLDDPGIEEICIKDRLQDGWHFGRVS
jgi:hypothetical protein